MNLLELHALSKNYQLQRGLMGLQRDTIRAVNSITLSVTQGETLGLVGESGCGKSTLAKCIVKLEKPSSGQILYKGIPATDWNTKTFRREVQMIFQDPYSSLNPRQKVKSILQEGLDIHSIGSPSDRKQKVKELLNLVGLRTEYINRYPHEFSGGQRQRIAIARALALNPRLIVCDEPVSALDVSVQAQVLSLLQKMQQQFELTYVFISHDLAVVNHIADRVIVMYLGQIVESGPCGDVFSFAKHPYTQMLLSAVLPPTLNHHTRQQCVKGDLPSPLNPPKGCPFHPRCTKAFKTCREEKPFLNEVAPDQMVACWLYTSPRTQAPSAS